MHVIYLPNEIVNVLRKITHFLPEPTCRCSGSGVKAPGSERGSGPAPRWWRWPGWPSWQHHPARGLRRARPCSQTPSRTKPRSPQRSPFHRWGNWSLESLNGGQGHMTISHAARIRGQAVQRSWRCLQCHKRSSLWGWLHSIISQVKTTSTGDWYKINAQKKKRD